MHDQERSDAFGDESTVVGEQIGLTVGDPAADAHGPAASRGERKESRLQQQAQRNCKGKAEAPIDLWCRRCLPLSPAFSTQPNGALRRRRKLSTETCTVNIGKTPGGFVASQVARVARV